MLDAIRKRKENWVSIFIVLAVVVVMGFFGIGGMGDKNDPNGPAAWVNGEVITTKDFNQEYEYTLQQYKQMLGTQYDEKLLGALNIHQRIIERLIQYRLVAQQAKKWDFAISDRELADHIRAIPYFQKDGKFDAELYAKIPNRGFEEQRQRENMVVGRFQTYLTDRIQVVPTEVRRAQALKETNVELEYAAIDFNALAPTVKPTAKDREEVLKNEGELKDYFEAHKSDYTEKASVDLRQIRVGVPFQAAADVKDKAKAKALEIAKSVNKDNFAEIAKAKSDDEHAKKGGNVGWVARGALEKPLEEAIDKLKDGEVSGVVETPFGYYVLQVVARKEAVTKPFESVKNEIADLVVMEKAKAKFMDEKRKSLDEMLAQGKSIDAELKKSKIEVKKTGAFSIGQGSIPGISSSDAMLDAVFLLTKEKPVAPKLFFAQDKYYYLKLLSVKPPTEAELAKNAESFEKTLATSLQGAFFSSWLEGVQKQAKIKYEKAFQAMSAAPSAEL